jgi:dihydroorotase
VENALALMLNQASAGRCSIEQIVQWMCDSPARVWDIVGKGRIAVGYDADLVLIDLNKRAVVRNQEQQTMCGWSPWHGETLTGWPVRTWVMGHEVCREGRFDTRRRGREAVFDHARGGYWQTS